MFATLSKQAFSWCRLSTSSVNVHKTRTYVKTFRRNPIKVFTRDGEDITPREREPLTKPNQPQPWPREQVQFDDGLAFKGLQYKKLTDADRAFKYVIYYFEIVLNSWSIYALHNHCVKKLHLVFTIK